MKTLVDPRYPKILTFLTGVRFQVIFVLVTLCLVIFYNAAYYLYVPVTGVWLDYDDQAPNSAVIYQLDPGAPGEKAGLRVGDRILTIDGRVIENLNIPVHQPKKPGDIETYVVQRDSQTLTIPVIVGSYADFPGYLADMIPVQVLSLLIYALGSILLFFSPASNFKARLVAMVWVLAGVAIAVTGPGYISCAWFAADLGMVILAALIFIGISAHLYFPVYTFSKQTRNTITWSLFVLSLGLIGAYLAQQIYLSSHHLYPRTQTTIAAQAIDYPFYLSCLINIALLLKNRFFIHDRDIKRQSGIIFLGTLLGFLPLLLFSELPALIFGINSNLVLLPTSTSILFMILIPISYGYVIHQRRLLKIDFIINRALVLFLLVLVILFSSMTLLGITSLLINTPSQIAIAGSFLCVLVALPSAALKKKIQIQVDHVLYGSYYDYTTVTSELSNQLTQINNRTSLTNVLINGLAAKMNIEKSAVLLLAGKDLELQGLEGTCLSIPLSNEVCQLLLKTQMPTNAQSLWYFVGYGSCENWKPFFWAQLLVPMIYHETLYGVLILGNRSAGEIYSNQDLEIVRTVGHQAALSNANITLFETLRGLAQQLVRSDEEQRKRVARDLHDSVLQNLFFIKQRMTKSDSEVASLLDRTVVALRQIIKSQRPSLLDQGLILALQDLISDMRKYSNDDLDILWHNYLVEEIRLPDEQVTTIYRIVQEALSNVLKHAQADQAAVTVQKEDGFLEFTIEDDGIGMPVNSQVEAGTHYGLLNMKERAAMIGAELTIYSTRRNGTKITVRLKQ